MPSNALFVKLEGVEELRRALAGAASEIRKKAVVNGLKQAGKVIQQAARANAPVLRSAKSGRAAGTVKKSISVRTSKYAKRDGNLGVYVSVRPLTAAKRRAFKRSQAASGATVAGKANPNDPYYWRWVEFGHRIVSRRSGSGQAGLTVYQTRLKDGRIVSRKKKYRYDSITGRRRHASGFVAPVPFMRPAAESAGPRAIQAFMQSVVPQIERLNNRAR